MHLATYSHTANELTFGAEEYCPDWCGCQRWGSSPSPTYFQTRFITRLKLYLTPRKSPGFGYDHQLGNSRDITIRTLSNSSVSITVTRLRLRIILVFLSQNYPNHFFVTTSIIPYHRYPSRNLILSYLLSRRLYYYNTHG